MLVSDLVPEYDLDIQETYYNDVQVVNTWEIK